MPLPVTTAGGTGSRLWLTSRELYPKQFLRLFEQNSVLQETIARPSGLEIHEPMITCNEGHRFLVAEQLRQPNKLLNNIILEPTGRNIVPVITLATLQATHYGDDPPMLVLAADHIISNQPAFHDDICVTEQYADEGHLVTFGTVSNILETCQAAVNAADNGSGFINIPHDTFCECPGESVDYAVMEKTADMVVAGLDADWSDVGPWLASQEVSPKDGQDNVLSGDAWVHNSENCYINSNEKLVAAIGAENLVIASTKDAVLVMSHERSQDVKKAVEFLKQNQRGEHKRHCEIYRSWGCCGVVVQTPRFNVNHITVKPGGVFSMQMHHHRVEHWVILAGTGQVMVNGKQFLLSENQSTSIPIGVEYRLENSGCIPLEVLEIQSGPYLDEDDIVRIKDQYGRC